jgi:hypothetical protein
MFIFVVQTLQNKWNEICMKQLAGGKCMENDCFLRTLKFEMLVYHDFLTKCHEIHQDELLVVECHEIYNGGPPVKNLTISGIV